MVYDYIICKILLIIYRIFLLLFISDKAGILNIPGNKLTKNGLTKEKIKLINVSFINEFEYLNI